MRKSSSASKMCSELLLIAYWSRVMRRLSAFGARQDVDIRTLADSMNLTFNRVQFTPDLMPSDHRH